MKACAIYKLGSFDCSFDIFIGMLQLILMMPTVQIKICNAQSKVFICLSSWFMHAGPTDEHPETVNWNAKRPRWTTLQMLQDTLHLQRLLESHSSLDLNLCDRQHEAEAELGFKPVTGTLSDCMPGEYFVGYFPYATLPGRKRWIVWQIGDELEIAESRDSWLYACAGFQPGDKQRNIIW